MSVYRRWRRVKLIDHESRKHAVYDAFKSGITLDRHSPSLSRSEMMYFFLFSFLYIAASINSIIKSFKFDKYFYV